MADTAPTAETTLVTVSLPATASTLAVTTSISRAPSARAAEPLDAAPFSFLFTGRHDGGALPLPTDAGHYALLLDAVADAKARVEAALAPAIAAEAAAAAARAPTDGGAAKKARG